MFIYDILATVARRCPKTITRLRYFKHFHRSMNLNSPFEEVNQLATYVSRAQLHNKDNRRWALLADKYAVRGEVAKMIGEEYLIPIYGHWENPAKIDFDSLPKEYILKTNNGCGTNVIVKDNSCIDRSVIVRTMKKALEFPYPELTAQLHYSHIPPCVVAEKLMVQGGGKKSLTDYKVYCVNGKPMVMFIHHDRDEHEHFSYGMEPYTLKWQQIPKGGSITTMPDDAPVAPEKPECLEKMIELAATLSKGEELLRVDFYIIDNKIYFGEFTFTPDTAFNSHFDPYQGVMNDILDQIKEDRKKGISSQTF